MKDVSSAGRERSTKKKHYNIPTVSLVWCHFLGKRHVLASLSSNRLYATVN